MNDIKIHQIIKKEISVLGRPVNISEAITIITQNYSYDVGQIRAHIIAGSVNIPARTHYVENSNIRDRDLNYDYLFSVDNIIELYDEAKHGKWRLEKSNDESIVTKDGKPMSDNPDSMILKSVKDLANTLNTSIILKILLENKASGFTASISDIKEKCKLLDFDGRFESENFTSILNALSELIEFNDEYVMLIFKKIPVNLFESLKICGQKITKHHIFESKRRPELWSILPGSTSENHLYLKEFVDTNSIGVGWSDVDDVSTFSEEQIRNEFTKKYDGRGLNSFLSFYNIFQGDLVVLTKGKQEIVDFGIVVDKYYYKDVGPESYPHRKNVMWLNQGTINVNELPDGVLDGCTSTCSKVSKHREAMINILLGNKPQSQMGSYFILTQNTGSGFKNIEEVQYQYNTWTSNADKLLVGCKIIIKSRIKKGNIDNNYFIGYGTIGTIEILPNKEVIIKYSKYEKISHQKCTKEIIDEINAYKKPPDKYHWSIHPTSKEIYEKIIDKQLVKSKDSTSQVLSNEQTVFFNILSKRKQLILYGPPGTGKTYNANQLSKRIILDNVHKETFTYKNAAIKILQNAKMPLHVKTIIDEALIQKLITIDGKTPVQTMTCELNRDIEKYTEYSVFKRTDANTFALNSVVKIKPNNETKGIPPKFIYNVTFHQSYSYEEFIEGIKPNLQDGKVSYKIEDGIFRDICEHAKTDSDNKYVLVIDEINRGNISKIFGDLITLIEDDKREDHVLTLAYSKNDFTVPKNVYIIGTMNTADRSLTPIDTALRRRFTFCELMPDYTLLSKTIDGISLQALLEKINEKIIDAGMREKQIGHSYLMDIDSIADLQFVFTYQIIPLLQDYFFNDYKKLEDILGSNFVDSKKMIIKDDWKRDTIKFSNYLKNAFGP